MLDEEKAIKLAINKLEKDKYKFLKNTAKALYRHTKFPIGEQNKGWVISFDLDVSKSFEPNVLFVYVSDPEAKVYIPSIL